MNLIAKPSKENIKTYVPIGLTLVSLSILDVFANAFFNLNLTKNSSLAAAIAYPDIVLVFAGTALMQTGRAIEIISITMLTYLTLSISISIFMNWYNKKMAIKEK